jgi:hypothetical protein
MTDGTVVVLDSAGGRIYRLRPRGRSLERAIAFNVTDTASLAPASSSVVYVSHPEGVIRIDLATAASSNVRAARGVTLKGLRRIRWHQGDLLGIQQSADGTLSAVRIRLDAAGQRALALSIIDRAASTAATIMNDAFYYAGRDGDTTTVRAVPLKKR